MNDDISLGVPVAGWSVPKRPNQVTLTGQHVQLEPLNADRHAAELFAANAGDSAGKIWDYLGYGPFPDQATYHQWIAEMTQGNDPVFFALRQHSNGLCGGVASFLRITPQDGTIEVGHINYAPILQRTIAATEAMFLMMQWAFDAGYRRYEWKCNALNIPSRRAAERLGFSFEGIFRQATISKGRNRDTAWFATIDKEWPALKAAFQHWLSPDNFDSDARQKCSLSDLTHKLLVARDPALL